MSLEAYASSRLGAHDGFTSIGDGLASLIASASDTPAGGRGFASQGDWFRPGGSGLEEAARARFVAFLADGNAAQAHAFLEGVNVVGGLYGLDFSDSRISNSNNLFLEVTYVLEIWGFIPIEVTQTAVAKLWLNN